MAGPDGRLPLTRKVGWAVGDFGFNIYWQALNLLMMPFYTDVLGLDARLAGTVVLLASLWDGFADSVIGAIADRTRTRYGSYRPYLIFASPVMVVAFMVAFLTPSWSQGGLFLYALMSQMFLRTSYSFVNIPYSSLSARISSDANERASLAGWRIGFAMLGGMLVTFLMPTVVDWLQARTGEESNWAYVLAAGLAGLLSLPIFWLCFATTREPATLAEANPKGFSLGAVTEDLRDVGRMLMTNGPLMRVFLCMIVSSLAFTMTNKCLSYYVDHYLQAGHLKRYIFPFTLFIQMIFCFIWSAVAQRSSKRTAWLSANVVSIVAYLVFWFSDSRDPLVAAILVAFIAMGNAAYLMLVWAMLPDTVEYNAYRTGRRHDAKVFGVASFSKQLALGLNGFILGWLLSAVGYVEKSKVQSAEAIEGVKAIMTLIPLAGLALSAIVIWGYRLDHREHRRISDVLAERDLAAAKAGPAAE